MINEIYINGDSYSAETSDIIPYSKYLSDLTNLPVTNFSMSGSSNDRIFRTTLEYCLKLTENQKPMVIVGFSFVTREEIWLDDSSNYTDRIRDFAGSNFVTADWIRSKDLDDSTMHLIINQNINKQVISFYTKLLMFTRTLSSLGLPYLIFSAANNKDFGKLRWDILEKLSVYQAIQQDPCVIDLHNFNIGSWAEQNNIPTTTTQHLFTDGHKKFADFLYSKIYDSTQARQV